MTIRSRVRWFGGLLLGLAVLAWVTFWVANDLAGTVVVFGATIFTATLYPVVMLS